jgi:Fur family ferric uptake transcriptional regulator
MPSAAALGKRTRQRKALLDALAGDPDFTSAQALHQRMLDNGEQIGLTTVYRTLHSLTTAGLVDTVRDPAGQQRFRARPSPEHQHYLVCRLCGNNHPVISSAVEHWAQAIGRHLGFTAIEHVIELSGICTRCRPQREKTAGETNTSPPSESTSTPRSPESEMVESGRSGFDMSITPTP